MEVRPIDYVVPMVFHDDVSWQQDFNRVGAQYDESRVDDFVRWRSWGTERLLVRCVRKYMPFVRTLYVILARESQKQSWMDEEEVRIVYHKDFIPEEYLPTFNSCAIEMFLHMIPDISDRFIYGNDDMFPLSPLTEDDFFEGDVPCLHEAELTFPASPNVFHRICRNALNFVAKEFGKAYTTTWLKGDHSLTPMLRDTWEYLHTLQAGVVRSTITPFRSSGNFIQWICPWWHYLSGNYVDKMPKQTYVSVKDSVDEVVAAIGREDSGVVCINDNECEQDYMKYGRAVIHAIEQKLNNN